MLELPEGLCKLLGRVDARCLGNFGDALEMGVIRDGLGEFGLPSLAFKVKCCVCPAASAAVSGTNKLAMRCTSEEISDVLAWYAHRCYLRAIFTDQSSER